jgi:hypothetical protein
MRATSSLPAGYNWEVDGNQGEINSLAPHWSPRIVYMRADVGHLASPVIPFAVFKDNPLLSFRAAQETRLENMAAEIEPCWNRPFSALTKTQHYFLIAWNTVPRVSARVVAAAELAFGIATPGPHYKRWIATHAVSYQGEPVAWCIEIDMLGEQEEVIEIVLSEGNMRHLFPSPLHATSA